ncbi:hypothetical protein JYU11_01255 [bacterium AH-315-G05]|nr:hypothetical protein [bacterium AH-315-L21]MBN4069513.1 hypothetical protein [bacterium AH-315-G05]
MINNIFRAENQNIREFTDILLEVQEHISGKYAMLISDDTVDLQIV